MARTVNFVNVIGSQSFQIDVKGLNIFTKLEVYYEGRRVPDDQLEPRDGLLKSKGYTIRTDENGSSSFIFYLKDLVADYKNQSEASFLNHLNNDAGRKTLVVVDEGSFSGDVLPDNYQSRVKCYAEVDLTKSIEIKFDELKDWGGSIGTQAGSSYTNTYE